MLHIILLLAVGVVDLHDVEVEDREGFELDVVAVGPVSEDGHESPVISREQELVVEGVVAIGIIESETGYQLAT